MAADATRLGKTTGAAGGDPSAPGSPGERNAEVISYLTMRQALGWCGIAVPAVMIVGGLIFHRNVFTSISAYYYSVMGDVLVALLVTIGIFLLAYRGYPKREDEWFSDVTVTSAAGIGALLVATFPTTLDCGNTYGDPPHIGLRTSCPLPYADFAHLFDPDPDGYTVYEAWFLDQIATPGWMGVVHTAGAALFFVSIAYMVGVHFRRERVESRPTPLRVLRDWVYVVCSTGMAACLVLMLAYFAWSSDLLEGVLPEARAAVDRAQPVTILEGIAILLFGIAWLIKGRQIMDDRAEDRSVFDPVAKSIVPDHALRR